MLRKLLHSSSYQVGTVFAVLMLFGILFVSYWLVIASDDTLLRESEEAVRAELRGLIAVYELGGTSALAAHLDARGDDQRSGFFYGLRDVAGLNPVGNIPGDLKNQRQTECLFEKFLQHDQSFFI